MKKSTAIIVTLGGFILIIAAVIIMCNAATFPGIDLFIFLFVTGIVLVLATGITLGVMLLKKLGQVGEIIKRKANK